MIKPRLSVFQILTLCGVLITLLAMPIGAPLWLDETISYWTISDDPRNAWERALRFQGQSPLYFLLLHYWAHSTGISEVLLRLPSMIAGIGSLALLFLIGRRWFDRRAGLLAMLLWLCFDETNTSFISARPYALGTFFTLLCIYCFDSWLRSNRRSFQWGSVAALVAAWYCHYFFGLAITVPIALYLLSPSESRHCSLKSCLLSCTLAGLFMAPGLLQLAQLAKRAKSISIAPEPTLLTYALKICPPYLLVFLILAGLMALIFGVGRGLCLAPRKNDSPYARACLVWWILPPTFFALYSIAAPQSLFLSRYFLWYQAGCALFFANLLVRISPTQARRIALVTMGFFLCSREVLRQHYFEDWPIAAALMQEAADSQTPTLLFSGLIESENTSWLQREPERTYLAAPLQYYKAPLPILLPVTQGPVQRSRYLSTHVDPVFAKQEPILFISYLLHLGGITGEDRASHEAFLEYAASKGYNAELLPDLQKPLVAFRLIPSTNSESAQVESTPSADADVKSGEST